MVPHGPADGVHLHACTLCEAGCGLAVTTQQGKVTLIRGDRDDVASGGYLCPKGTALKDLQYDPDRLVQPLVRGQSGLAATDNETAFSHIRSLLRPIIDEHGADSVGLVIGNAAVHRTGIVLYLLDLMAALGSRNVYSSASLDQLPKQVASGLMFGDFYSVPVPDVDRTGFLLIVGANPVVSNGSMWTVPDAKGRLRAMRARGGRLVVIDPRRTETAELADLHLAPRPGSDVYLLAAMVHVIVAEDEVRFGRADGHVNGLDELRQVVAGFAPEAVADRCGIDAASIRRLAHDLRASASAAVYGRMGTTTQRHGTVTSWLIDVLNVVSGNLDRPGGAMFPMPAAFAGNTSGEPGRGPGVTLGSHHSRVSGVPEMMGQLPLTCLAEEILTPGQGQIRALITIGANPALSVPDSARMAEALSSLDALVALDIYVNETTRHADVIVPGPSPLEDDHYDVFFAAYAHRNTARFSPPVLPAPSTVLADDEAMLRLIAAVGADEPPVDRHALDALDDRLTRAMLGPMPDDMASALLGVCAPRRGALRRVDLALRSGPYGDGFGANPGGLNLAVLEAAPSGIDYGPLAPRLPEVLRTPSGAVELCPSLLAQALAMAEADLVQATPPLQLIGRRHLRSNNSWMHNLPVLAKGAARCTLLVHPNDAERLGLRDGDDAEMTSAVGSVVAPVHVTDAMREGVVSLPHGWGHDQAGAQLQVARKVPGVNMNLLLATERDTVTGAAVLNDTAVQVRRFSAALG